MIEHFRDGYLKIIFIFSRNVADCMCLIRRNDDLYRIVIYVVKFQWLDPCIK